VPGEDQKLSGTHAARTDATTAGKPMHAHNHDLTRAKRQMKAEGKGKAKAKGRTKGRTTHAHLEMRHIGQHGLSNMT